MQDPKISKPRKPWYQRAMEMASVWKTSMPKSSTTEHHMNNNSITNSNIRLWKTISKSSTNPSSTSANHGNDSNRHNKLRKCTSLKVATSFTRVCLCAPIYSYNYELFQAADHQLPPRRSQSYPRSSSSSSKGFNYNIPNNNNNNNNNISNTCSSTRLSVEGGRPSSARVVFRGKSLTDDVLMRRFVVEEEAMMQVRRRNQMEVIRKRNLMRRKKLGPSPLSRMVMADPLDHGGGDEHHQDQLIN